MTKNSYWSMRRRASRKDRFCRYCAGKKHKRKCRKDIQIWKSERPKRKPPEDLVRNEFVLTSSSSKTEGTNDDDDYEALLMVFLCHHAKEKEED